MTILEKIKRCVELVWDFEEIYDWSDIEAFCGKELSTYPQHDEIMEYFKHIENLEKANEWQYVSEKGTPQKEGHYLVCLRNKDKDIFDCWIYYDKDVGWYSMEVRMKDIYAWKEIVLPESKEIKENENL